MQRDWNSNVNQTKIASFSFINSKDERFHRPIIFKIIVRHLNVEELQIPPQFLEYIKEVPFHTAILKGPSGCYWHVKICREAQGVFLRDGWKEFQRENSIMHHDLLIFRYIGNMFFEIEVFDENGLEKINATSFANIYEAAPSSKERKGTPGKHIEAAAPSNERRDTPHRHLEAAPSGVKRRGRLPKNNVDRFLCSAAQISYRSGLCATEPERIANNCEAAPSMERMANNCEAAASTRKRNRPKTHLETTPSGAKRRGRPRKHIEASSSGKEKSGTELQTDDVRPLTLQAVEGTDCREYLKASSHDEKRSDRTQNDDNVCVDMDQLKLYDNVPDRIESGRISSYCETAPSKERIANNCEAPASMRKTNGPQIHLETTPSGAQRSGRPHEHLEASSFCKDKSGTELQRDNVGPLTLQASEGTDCREHLKASSHDEKKRSDKTQNDDIVSLNMHQLELYDYVPGRIESERIACNCEAALSQERISNNWEAAASMVKINRPQIHLETTPSGTKKRGRPRKHLEASSLGKDKSGTELQRDDVSPLTLRASKGTDCREHLKASSHDKKRRSDRPQNDDNVRVGMQQSKLYDYVPDETGGMLPYRSSDDQDVTNRERPSGCRMRLEQCLLEGMLGTGERDLDGSDKEQHTQRKKKQNEANKNASLPTMQTPSEKDIKRAWEKSESLVLKSPYYKCYLESFHVQKYILPMSKPFAQRYFPSNKTAVVLRNSKGQDWTVNVVPTKTGHSFTGGWRSFALANKLKEGDVCVFELVERDVIQVHVFPCTGEVDSESSGSD